MAYDPERITPLNNPAFPYTTAAFLAPIHLSEPHLPCLSGLPHLHQGGAFPGGLHPRG